MENKKWITYHKKYKVDRNCTKIQFGRAKPTGEFNGDNQEEVEITKVIDEFTFYYAYLTISNITSPDDANITPMQRLVLCALMVKPMDFCLPVDSKGNKLSDIAKELSNPGDTKTPNSIYQSVKRLKDKGYLTYTEDKFVVIIARLQAIRSAVKAQLKKEGIATFDYLFKCYIEPYEIPTIEDIVDTEESSDEESQSQG